jgi:hypothetical protein
VRAGGGAVGWGTALQAEMSRVLPGVPLAFFIDIIFRGVDSVSDRNEYQEYFLAGKGDRCVGLTTLPTSCADCIELWERQPSGTVRAVQDSTGTVISRCICITCRNYVAHRVFMEYDGLEQASLF